MQYKIQAWAVDNRPEKPEDFDPDEDEAPEDGFRTQSGKKKIREESPPFDDIGEAVEALNELLTGMTKDQRARYHTIRIQGVTGGNGSSVIPSPGS